MKNKWISCSNSMPSYGQAVLYVSNGYMFAGHYDSYDKKWYYGDGLLCERKITHWQNLPDKPETL